MINDTSIGQQSFSPTSWLESRVEGNGDSGCTGSVLGACGKITGSSNGSASFPVYLSDVQVVHTLIPTPCATSPWRSMLYGSTDSASILFGCAPGDAQSCRSLATRVPGGALRPLGVRETGPS